MNVAKLDKIFSEYIRRRDSDDNGIGACCSCGKMQHWKNMDCGHFVNRKHMSLRFSEVNCNMQCYACNRFDEGNVVGYSRFLIKKHGAQILAELEISKKRIVKFTQFEIDVLTNFYIAEVKQLKTL